MKRLRRILVTGSTGLLGRNVTREIYKHGGYEVIPHSSKTLDLRETERVYEFFVGLKPDLVIHTAAMTNVDECEVNPEDAYLINWIATREITKVCRDLGIPIIYLSTDFVFDGKKGVYEESDEPYPLSIYGKTKLLGEEEVKSWGIHCIIRVSWLFGGGGGNFFSRLPHIISTQREIHAVIDQWSCPTYAPAVASVLVDMVLKEMPLGTFHLAGEERTTPFEFATNLKKMMNADVKIIPVNRKSIQKAPRPKSSVLRNNKLKDLGYLVPGYRHFLDDFLREVSKHDVGL